MSDQPSLTIWTNTKFPEEIGRMLAEKIAPHRLVHAAQLNTLNTVTSLVDMNLEQADIAFGQPNAEQAMTLSNLKWIHLTTAGYTAYDRDDFKEALRARGGRLTNSSGVYDDPCAQHLLAMMMSFARKLPESLMAQLDDRAWHWAQRRKESFLLNGQTALIFGFGAIAARLCELLAPFKMRLIGVRRSVKGDEPIEMITEDQLAEFLPQADHIINILPGNTSTALYFDSDKFQRMRSGAMFYNVGRGATVDQEAILTALESGRLAAAYLDVMTPEPLPPDHPLWTAPNCYITPHSAGGQDREMEVLVERFLENLQRYLNHEELQHQII